MERFEKLMNDVDDMYQYIELSDLMRKKYIESIEELELEKSEIEEFLEKFEKATKVIQKIKDDRNNNAKKIIEKLVDYGLETLLDERRYEILIEDDNYGKDSKITRVELISTDTGNPRKTGNAVNQSVALFFIVSLLKLSNCSRILGMDEALSGASGATAERLGELLVSLSENDDFQIFLVNQVMSISNNDNIERIFLENIKGSLRIIEDPERQVELYNKLIAM